MSKELHLLEDLPDHRPGPEGKGNPVSDSPSPADSELFIRRAFTEDPKKGFELLFREYYAPLCSHAVRFVYSRDIARDLVSDLFCAFFQKELYKRIDSSYRAYLYRCVRNDSLKYLQRESGYPTGPVPADADDEMATGVSTPEDLLRYEELAAKIETVIGGLSPQSRKVFLMNRYEGKKYQQISAEMQISLKTVEAHMSKALAVLRKTLQTDWPGILSLVFFNESLLK